MSSIIGIRDGASSADVPYSPAKEKAATRGGVYNSRRIRLLLGGAKVKLLLAACMAFALILFAGRVGSIMGWNPNPSSSVSSPSRCVWMFFNGFLICMSFDVFFFLGILAGFCLVAFSDAFGCCWYLKKNIYIYILGLGYLSIWVRLDVAGMLKV